MMRIPVAYSPAPRPWPIQTPQGPSSWLPQPPVGERVAAAALGAFNRSSRHGPDGGNLACAFMVNEILQQAIGRKYGADPDTVASVRADLLDPGRHPARRGQAVPPAEARPGDLAFSLSPAALLGQGGGTAHMGIVVRRSPWEPPVILSNSSSRRAFNNVDSFDGFARRHEYFEIIRLPEAG